MRAVALSLMVLAPLTLGGSSPDAKKCCARSCTVVAEQDDDIRFDLSPACRAGSSEMQGEASDGTTYKVNACPNCTTLCAPQDGPSGFGAIVQSVGQPPPPGTATCYHPDTRAPINCTEPCEVVAVWDGAGFFLSTGEGQLAGVKTRFRPVPASPAGPFGAMCGGGRLLQPWLRDAPTALQLAGAPSAPPAMDGSFRVELTTVCDILALQPFVSNVSSPNASDPCRIQITVRSVAGCSELRLGVGWLLFSAVVFAMLAVTLAGSAYTLVAEGRCAVRPLPCGATRALWWLKARLGDCRDVVALRLLRSLLLDRSGGEDAAAAEAAYEDRMAEAGAGAQELATAVCGECGARCCAGCGRVRRPGASRLLLGKTRSTDSEADLLHEMPGGAGAEAGGAYSRMPE